VCSNGTLTVKKVIFRVIRKDLTLELLSEFWLVSSKSTDTMLGMAPALIVCQLVYRHHILLKTPFVNLISAS